MSEDRIATIVREINYWKEHHLLPDIYCDFLLALYTNGEGVTETENNAKKRHKNSLQIILVSILLPFSFYVIYFTQVELFLQLGMLLLFLCYSGWTYASMKNRYNALYHAGLITSLFLIFLITLTLGKLFQFHNIYTSLFFTVNFCSWILIGRRQRLKYLVFTGIVALLFTCLYIIL
ncbi:hypothetical protein BN988_00318 [Oceanobacillus picturae]|uniref:Uncharacterized protein n=1 Tax=Oceanobacillus picturae TaxID=171693 RepID=W9AGP7_9BACI|nr:hypothetical protein [Oceanobacillus picturae]CDO01871.1 hypothetical protein BN988_00318 [Oceanobacillus picturae]